MSNVIDLQFNNTRVPFVKIGVSGTIYVGPYGDLALVQELAHDRHVRYLGDLRIRHEKTPEGTRAVKVKSLFCDLNISLIEESAATARDLFADYQK